MAAKSAISLWSVNQIDQRISENKHQIMSPDLKTTKPSLEEPKTSEKEYTVYNERFPTNILLYSSLKLFETFLDGGF